MSDNEQEDSNNDRPQGPLRTKEFGRKGDLIMQNIPIKRSNRTPLSLEEAGKRQPGQMDPDYINNIPGASVLRSRERRYSNDGQDGGAWYDV